MFLLLQRHEIAVLNKYVLFLMVNFVIIYQFLVGYVHHASEFVDQVVDGISWLHQLNLYTNDWTSLKAERRSMILVDKVAMYENDDEHYT